MSEDNLLNAMDGVARYEARRDMLNRDPAEAIRLLTNMLIDGTARYPSEIRALIAMVERGESPKPVRPARDSNTFTPRKPRSKAEVIESLVRRVGDPLRANRQIAEQAYLRLVDIGAPAVPALVKRLYDHRAKKRRHALFQVLGEIAAAGDETALNAIRDACDHDDESIEGPARAVLEHLQGD